ncbi:MAG: CoB--CoM heterodisulfide reductase iron-sulfur subunit A family protein [Methanobacteriota archaeon]|nr:MAG: CoB--CoM heterodisulfide reductase iron-sulfur subunit A family protein [Euryarchaeota archaeon]
MTTKVLVIGGGPAGLTAAETLVSRKQEVVLVEKEDSLGGMARELACKGISECRDCGVCYAIDRADEATRTPGLEVLLKSNVTSLERVNGGFKVKIRSLPRYVTGDCIDCNKCVEACPVDGKAIFAPTGSGRPRPYWIDRGKCLHFKKSKCEKCAQVCPTNAVDYEDRAKNVTRNVSRVILATGIEPTDAREVPRLGYGTVPNVVSSVDVERILNDEGRVVRPLDGVAPKKVAMIQCVGSRSEKSGVEYCSKFCCKYGTKIAQLMMDGDPDMDLDFYFMDLRTLYEPQEDFKRWAKGMKRKVEKKKVPRVRLIRSMPSQAYPGEEGKIWLRSSGETDSEVTETPYDLVVLSVGMKPRALPESLTSPLGVTLDCHGFARCETSDCDQKVLALGAACGPMDIEETVTNAIAAAAIPPKEGN